MKQENEARGMGKRKARGAVCASRLACLFFALLLCGRFVCAPLALHAQSGAGQSASQTENANSGESTPPQEAAFGEERGIAGLYAPEEEPQAAAACLLSVDTGLAVYEKNADEPMEAASLVKMMTCMLTMDYAKKYNKNLDETLVSSAGKNWIYDDLYGKNASTADIRKGETLSLRELLYAALLPSANEAALLLADHVCTGYMANFLYQMNTRAQALGCTGTYFADANGLSPESVSTARDMALIGRAFLQYPELVEIAATPQYELAAHELHENAYNIFNTNRLVAATSPYHKLYPDIQGAILAGKTGSLGEWQNFVAGAAKNGETYVAVVLHSPNSADSVGAQMDPPQARPALVEAAALLDWAFKSLTVTSALDTTQPVTELRVRYSTDQNTVLLVPGDDIKTVLLKDGDPTALRKHYDLPESVAAPVQEGAVIGSVTLTVEGVEIGTSRLMASKAISRNPTLYAFTRTGEFFTGLYFRVLLCVVLVCAGAWAGLIALAHNSRARHAAAPRAAPPRRKEKQKKAR